MRACEKSVFLFVLRGGRAAFNDKYQLAPARQLALTPALSQWEREIRSFHGGFSVGSIPQRVTHSLPRFVGVPSST
jgi:hypothetical protein